MCICINCRHIIKCSTYFFIKKQYLKIHNNPNRDFFYPSKTIVIVQVNKHKETIALDWDLKECASFAEKPGNWLN